MTLNPPVLLGKQQNKLTVWDDVFLFPFQRVFSDSMFVFWGGIWLLENTDFSTDFLLITGRWKIPKRIMEPKKMLGC